MITFTVDTREVNAMLEALKAKLATAVTFVEGMVERELEARSKVEQTPTLQPIPSKPFGLKKGKGKKNAPLSNTSSLLSGSEAYRAIGELSSEPSAIVEGMIERIELAFASQLRQL